MRSQNGIAALRFVRDRRGDLRTSLFLSSDVELDGVTTCGLLRNLSAGGARLDLDVSPEIGAPVHLAVRNIGRVRGHVIWVRGGGVGIQFETRIDPAAAFPVRHPVKAMEMLPVATDHKRPALGRFRLAFQDANA